MNSKMKLTVLAISLFFAGSLSSYSQEVQIISKPEMLFKKGDAGIAEFRIPSLITTIKGTVLAVCDGRVDRSGDVPNNIDLVMRRQVKGKSWEPIKRIVDFAGKHGLHLAPFSHQLDESRRLYPCGQFLLILCLENLPAA